MPKKKIQINDSVAVLKGVGAKALEHLHAKSIYTLQDLIFYLPYRYENRSRLMQASEISVGHYVFCQGEVVKTQIQFGKKRSLLCQVMIGHVLLGLRFYYFSKAQQNNLAPSTLVRIYGLVARGASGIEIYHPEYLRISDPNAPVEKSYTPVYPALTSISQKQWRKWVQQALNIVDQHSVQDLLSHVAGVQAFDLSLFESLQGLHFPKVSDDLNLLLQGQHRYQQRLILEELIAHTLARKCVRQVHQQQRSFALPIQNEHVFLEKLSFTLTQAQQRVAQEVANDLSKNSAMLRLVQGDVGSGKTVIAALAAWQTIQAGGQVAIMAPTEILAEQHVKNFAQWFADFKINIALLASSVKAKPRKEILKNLQAGDVHILIGTHAIFQEDVVYNKLALVVIDEQHRFGVHQRLALQNKSQENSYLPHQLVMTATPIPRTLAMTMYADMDVSVIDELPAGRQAIDTVLMSEQRIDALVARVRHACEQGKQVYWVCTLIEASETLESQPAEEAYELLSKALPNVKVAMLHGRMKADEKQNIMQAFAQGETQLLVATTVIEVGVDVPNASIIVIQNPERLGLAQLHQLRGRVGRGAEKSFCVLLYGHPLSQIAKERLNIIKQHQDGFVIAEEDLRIRGAGEYLGTRQSGELSMRVADIQRDAYLLDDAKQLAQTIFDEHAERIKPLIQRWVPNAEQYAKI